MNKYYKFLLDRGTWIYKDIPECYEVGFNKKEDFKILLSIARDLNLNILSIDSHRLEILRDGSLTTLFSGSTSYENVDCSYDEVIAFFETKFIEEGNYYNVLGIESHYETDDFVDFSKQLELRKRDNRVLLTNFFETKFLQYYFDKSFLDDFIRVYYRSISNGRYEACFSKSEKLKLKDRNDSCIDRKIKAKLNESIEIEFLISIEDGYLGNFECSVVDGDWPEKINSVDFFDIEEV
jgi:hypothetical protein